MSCNLVSNQVAVFGPRRKDRNQPEGWLQEAAR
jgi:hypothetical protein